MTSRRILFSPVVPNGGVTAFRVAVTWLSLSVVTASASAPEIEFFHWGYNGRVVPTAFNPLTVVVRNPGDVELSGQLELQRLRGGYWPVGLPIRQPVFVSPRARRPVRFYPYVLGEYEGWRLSWLDPDGSRRELNTTEWKPRLGEPATVLLDEPDRLSRRSGRLWSLDESWFPAVSTATDGLAGVALDHVPRWEAPRRRAFLEWLGRGGTLHVLEGPDDRRVVFGGQLKVLNGTETLTRYGAGRVIRQPFGVNGIPDEFPPRPKQQTRDVAGDSMTTVGIESFGPIDDSILFSTLRSMTRPQRNWPLIYLACLVYMAVLFPGGFVYGQGDRDYRAVLGLLGGTVVVFSVLFFLVGRRDGVAGLVIRTATVARHLDDGDIEYQQWAEAAVTRGGNYRFTHQGRARLYSTAQILEKNVGSIEHGAAASLTVDLPPYSSSTFLVKGRLSGMSIGLSPVDVQATGGRLQRLVLSTGEGFPATIRQASVLVGSRFYSLVHGDGLLQLDQSNGIFADLRDRSGGRLNPAFDPDFDQYREIDEAFDDLYEVLTLRSLGFADRASASHFELPPGRMRVFVYAPAPGSLAVQADQSADQVGRVLYTWDFQSAFAP